MYEAHWGLRQSAFKGRTDAGYFHPSPPHDEALARLSFLVENRKRLGLVLGLPGSGKTLLLKTLARQLEATGAQVALVNMASLGAHDMLWELAARLALNPRRQQTRFQLWQTIVDRITENRYQQLRTVILFDDADEASPEVLTDVMRLVRHESSGASNMTAILAADTRFQEWLGERLLELVELKSDLEFWQPDDTREYLKTSLARAGGDRCVFPDEAALRLHELARGVPRQVNHLAEMALVAGAAHHLEQIDTGTIDAVYEELVLGH